MEEKFKEAQWQVLHLNKRPSNEDLLDLYGLSKQAQMGDVHEPPPEDLANKDKAQYHAWASKRGLSREEATKAYIQLVDRLAKEDQ